MLGSVTEDPTEANELAPPRILDDHLSIIREVDDVDLTLRNLTYQQFVEFGRAPTALEIARKAGSEVEPVQAAWQRLHDMHALVLNPTTLELRMANPFSAVPTAYRVEAAGCLWYANCAWDAFGICGALHVGGRIETSCPDCGNPIAISVVDEKPNETGLLSIASLQRSYGGATSSLPETR